MLKCNTKIFELLQWFIYICKTIFVNWRHSCIVVTFNYRKIMKKFLSFGSIACMSMVLSFISCSSEEHAGGAVSTDLNSQDELCQQVGADHNLLLDEFLSQMFATTRSIVIPKPDPIDPIDPPVVPLRFDYKLFECVDLLTIPENEKIEVKKVLTQVRKDYLMGKIDTTVVFEPTDQYLVHKTQLETVMNDGDYDLTSLFSRIDNIKASAKAIEDETERQAILMGASIAKNSLQYWHDSFDRICDSLDIVIPPIGGFQPLSAVSKGCQQTRGWLGYNWKAIGIADLGTGLMASMDHFSNACKFLGPVGWKAAAIYIGSRAAVGSLVSMLSQHAGNNGYSVSLIDYLVDCTYDATLYDLKQDFLLGSVIIKPIFPSNTVD